MHDFRKRLLTGERLVGTMGSLGYPEVGEIMAGAGFDWLFLDAEHSPMTAVFGEATQQAARDAWAWIGKEVVPGAAVETAIDGRGRPSDPD
jgi:2-keto-3-deoxy-L-rhamnonate aldolase RhmA